MPPHTLRLVLDPPGAPQSAGQGIRGFGPQLTGGRNARGVGLQTLTEGAPEWPGDPGPLDRKLELGPWLASDGVGPQARAP